MEDPVVFEISEGYLGFPCAAYTEFLALVGKFTLAPQSVASGLASGNTDDTAHLDQPQKSAMAEHALGNMGHFMLFSTTVVLSTVQNHILTCTGMR